MPSFFVTFSSSLCWLLCIRLRPSIFHRFHVVLVTSVTRYYVVVKFQWNGFLLKSLLRFIDTAYLWERIFRFCECGLRLPWTTVSDLIVLCAVELLLWVINTLLQATVELLLWVIDALLQATVLRHRCALGGYCRATALSHRCTIRNLLFWAVEGESFSNFELAKVFFLVVGPRVAPGWIVPPSNTNSTFSYIFILLYCFVLFWLVLIGY